jgi:hypothetical protein
MNQSMSIPIKVQTPARRELPSNGSRAEDTRAEPERLPSEGNSAQETYVPTAERPDPTLEAGEGTQSDLQEWRDRALRLQADMDNYRRRQQRLAQNEIQTEWTTWSVLWHLRQAMPAVCTRGLSSPTVQPHRCCRRKASNGSRLAGISLIRPGTKPWLLYDAMAPRQT